MPSPVVLTIRPVVLGDFRIEKLAAQRLEALERAFLVRPRTHDIRENPML
jgi:hypothetical protein